MSAVADVLNGAADLIERDGWVQHQPRGEGGELCVVRALGDAIGGATPWRSDLYDAATAALRETTGAFLMSAWQDQPGRTQAEVVAALRAAAERASMSAYKSSRAVTRRAVLVRPSALGARGDRPRSVRQGGGRPAEHYTWGDPLPRRNGWRMWAFLVGWAVCFGVLVYAGLERMA